MKVIVDSALCALHGDCVMEAPEVFDLEDDSDVVILLDDKPPAELRSQVEAAARMCPVSAITIKD